MQGPELRAVLERLLARVDPGAFAERATATWGGMRAYTDFVAAPDGERDRGRAAILAVLAQAQDWVVDDRPPTEAERLPIVDLVRVRAAEGMPMADGLLIYRSGARQLLAMLREVAGPEEQGAVAALAEGLFGFVDVVSEIFAEVYAEEADAPRAAVERRSRDLLDALADAGRPLTVADHERAARLRFAVQDAYEPFVAALVDGHARRHHELAARLRASGALAVTEGRRVAGLAPRPLRFTGAEADLVVAVDTPVARAEVEQVLGDLRRAIELPAVRARRGVVDAQEVAPELMVTAPGRAAERLRRAVLAPLEAAGQPRLLETLRALVLHNFDRGATSRALHLHRNSLAYRVQRIEQLIGLDLASQRGRGLAWLATLELVQTTEGRSLPSVG